MCVWGGGGGGGEWVVAQINVQGASVYSECYDPPTYSV